MYERSAIVLEKYIDRILGYKEINSIKSNFDNYCELVENLDKFNESYSKEQIAIQEFEKLSNEIKEIQSNQEKLYKQNARLEYNRNLLFNNTETNVKEIERCILNIEKDIDINADSFKKLREKYILAITNFKEKEINLEECKKNRKESERDYSDSFARINDEFEDISVEYIEYTKKFINSNNVNEKQSLYEVMTKNGKGEKNPFNEDVIYNATYVGIDLAKKEAECFMYIYDKTKKLFKDILNENVKLEKYKEYMKNAKAKLDFLFAEKEYLIQFLDNERITVIHGKNLHKKLMEEACENLKSDIMQINNLYELILREVSGKPTKRAYKELYNKSYLMDIEEKDANFQKERFKLDTSELTLVNSNYWRIEGIKNIYTVFYETVSEVFGKDLAEFDIPKQIENSEENVKIKENQIDKIIEESIEKISPEIKDEIDKKVNIVENKDNNNENNNNEEIDNDEFDIFGEKYKDFEAQIEELEDIRENTTYSQIKGLEESGDDKDDFEIFSDDNEKVSEKNEEGILDIFDNNEENNVDIETFFDEDDVPYDSEDELFDEDSIFSNRKNSNKKSEIKDSVKEKTSKNNLFSKIIKMNKTTKKKTVKE